MRGTLYTALLIASLHELKNEIMIDLFIYGQYIPAIVHGFVAY